LRLDSVAAMLKGGESGPVVVPKQSNESPLIWHVTGTEGAAKMPPKGDPLSISGIQILRTWIDQGAIGPSVNSDRESEPKSGDWWSFQPLVRPNIPAVSPEQAEWIRTPIDAFILAKLESKGLPFSPEADRRTLIRRLSLDLTGLPPTPSDLDEFVRDRAPDAYERLVERLLASPRYGERWARHWLDVAHYADSHGQDQDRPRPNAWPYRDYLIESFNEDKSYQTFVLEQVAGDALWPDQPRAIVATGFLAAGPWDESGLRDIQEDSIDRQIARYLDRDDMVSSTMSTFNALTVGCARCHDHKFDPITQADYYAIQADFAGIDKAEREYDADPSVVVQRLALERLLADARNINSSHSHILLQVLQAAATVELEQTSARLPECWTILEPSALRSSKGSLLNTLIDRSVLAVGPRPETDSYTLSLSTPSSAITGLRLELLPDESLPMHGPGRQDNGNLHLSEIRVKAHPRDRPAESQVVKFKTAAADFDQDGWGVSKSIDGNPATAWGIHPAVGVDHEAVFEFESPVGFQGGTILEVELDQLHGAGHLIGRFRISTTSKSPFDASMKPVPQAIAELLAVPPQARSQIQRQELAKRAWERKLQTEIENLPPRSVVYCGTNQHAPDGSFKAPATPRIVHILKRGDINQPGQVAIPGAVQSIPGLEGRFELAKSDDEAERRIALANWLADRQNPFTWRTIVNRVWHYHFGKGIVDTPNDLGRMGGQPSHPELLDWLAIEFRDSGGSLKDLHRLIVTSNVYRQAVTNGPSAQAIDADNRLLWRMNRGRLDAEGYRDSVLMASSQLDGRMYGPPVMLFEMKPGVHVTPQADYDRLDLDAADSRRRGVYRYIFRTKPDPFLEVLDCPDASQSAPVRMSSVSPLQALSLWNNKFTLHHSEQLARLALAASDDLDVQINDVSQRILGRTPSRDELPEWAEHARRHGLANFCRVLFNSSEFLFID
jgi:Protein of unknown function (DUF1549)/Protein of unknown function (DUF1553)/Planctomycete cytochrome C